MLFTNNYSELEIEMISESENIYYNHNNNPYVILDSYRKNNYNYFLIEFLNSGYIKEIRKSVVLQGYCKDPYSPDVCNVACSGEVKTTENNGRRKKYTTWKNMINRCYNKESKDYKFYGEKGIYVSDNWLYFENFLHDIELIEGFNEELFYSNKIELDKDIKTDNKFYSLENCKFVSKKENYNAIIRRKYLPERLKTKCVAIDSDNNEYCIINIPLFADTFNLNRSGIYSVLNGHKKSHKGWKSIKIN